jgi:hypothetical protein
VKSLVPDVSCSVCGAEPSNEKPRGEKVARRRLARKEVADAYEAVSKQLQQAAQTIMLVNHFH